MTGTKRPRTPWLRRWGRVTAWLEDAMLVALLCALIALAAAQIILRNLFDGGLVWGEPLTKVLVLWVALLGAMAATRDGNHITIDVLSRFLPPWAKTAARALADLFAAAVCAVLAYHAARLVLIDREAGTLAFTTVPTWVCELIIPAGFAVMALRFLAAALTAMFGAGRREP